MSLPLDDLPSMALFAQVVQLRSFSAAAREAGLVKSAVSKRIAALEARIGVRLLIRTSRRLAPTSEGLAFYEHCVALCAAARAAVDSVGDARSARGIVRVNASGAFAALYLARSPFSSRATRGSRYTSWRTTGWSTWPRAALTSWCA